MTLINPGRPESTEYLAYYGQYISRVPDGNILDLLARQFEITCTWLVPLSAAQANFRPKPADWNVTEVVGHLADTERVFAYRALCIARANPTPLPNFDQDLFVANANFSSRSLSALLAEFTTVRQATLAFLRTLDAAAWLRQGIAADHPISVRALAYIMAGHELHHGADFRQRYNV